MNQQRWEQIKAVFGAVVEQPFPQRKGLVLEMCKGDHELVAEVEGLLEHHRAASQFLELSNLGIATRLFHDGHLVAQRYRIAEFLGSGGMAEVYQAEDIELGECIALKVIHPQLSIERTGLDRFRREVQLARQVTHPNVCRVFDMGRDQCQGREIIFLTMELIRGETLADRIKRTGRFLQSDALALAIQLCHGLGAAHDAGVLHRDFKPGNVLLVDLKDQIHVSISDFGIARTIRENEDSHRPLTDHGAVVGTPVYMSPEQLVGKPLTVAADIYSLGLVLYEMITGAKPFGQSLWTSALRRLTEDPVEPAQIVQDLDTKWNQTILRCLRRNPAERFGAPSEIIESLLGEELISSHRRPFRSASDVHPLKAAIPADYWKRSSPFRSLQAFEPEDAWLFFGRDLETNDLVTRLKLAPTIVVVGNSGSGKSSLIRAGLIPALRRGQFCSESSVVDSWRIAVFRPSGAPFDYLAETLPGQLAPDLSLAQQAEFIADCRNRFPSGGDALRNAISALASTATKSVRCDHVLLVADQFEEIFTLTRDQQTRDKYIDALLTASRTDTAIRVYLVLALRADFYANCLQHVELSRCLQTNLYNVPRMGIEQLRATIEERLSLTGSRAESGLIDTVLEDVGAEPGNLALLEHALSQLWQECGGGGAMLTNKAYSQIGRLRGALGKHADQVYEAVAGDVRKRLLQNIFLELVHLGEGGQDTRRRVRKPDLLALGDSDEIETLLDRLASSRLILTGSEGSEIFVEVSHEALIREWPALRDWLAENREELRLERRLLQAAEEWDALQRDVGALLQGVRLEQGKEWLTRHPHATTIIRELVDTSIQAQEKALQKAIDFREREVAQLQESRRQAEARAEAEIQLRTQQELAAIQVRRSAIRLRWLSSILAGLLLIVSLSVWLAYRQALITQSNALAAQSQELSVRDRGRALDLAIRSWETAKTEQARIAVAKAFPQFVATLHHDDTVEHAAISLDGGLIVTSSRDHTARIWNSTDGHLIATLQHGDSVWRAAFAPDSRTVVTASSDKTARLWSSENGQLVATLVGHKNVVPRVAFSPDGRRVATGSWDSTARIWSRDDGHLLATLSGHTGAVAAVAFSPQGERILTASNDHTARVWDASDGHLTTTLVGHKDVVTWAEFSHDGQRILTASHDHTARIWNLEGRVLAVLEGHMDKLNYATFSPDGRRIVTASNDHTARIWNSLDGTLLATLKLDGAVWRAAYSLDGRHIVTVSHDTTARVWNSSDGKLLAMLEGHTDKVSQIAFFPDNDRIVTASDDHTARIWSNVAGRLLTTLSGHADAVWYVVSSPDGEHFATASRDGTARIWNGKDGTLVATLDGAAAIQDVEFSPDGRRIVTASSDGTARLWNASDGGALQVLRGHSSTVQSASFSPDGRRVVTASWDSTARIWSSVDGHLITTLQGHSGRLFLASFSPDSQRVVTASWDHTARIWSSADGHLVATLEGHSDGVTSAVFSPDGQQIVTSSWDHTARIWDGSNGRLLSILQGHNDRVLRTTFSPDGTMIITTSADKTARLWRSSNGRLLATLQGHTDQVWRAAFSPDGRRIVTASFDGTAKVWSAEDGHLLATLQGHTDRVWCAAFSPNGRLVITGSDDKTARVWQLMTLSDIEQILSR